MDWNEIKLSYPNAFDDLQKMFFNYRFFNTPGRASIIDKIEGRLFIDRDLYDFFDKHGIYISVYMKLISGFYIDMIEKGHYLIRDLPVITTNRMVAEKQAFGYAFKRLETRLNEMKLDESIFNSK